MTEPTLPTSPEPPAAPPAPRLSVTPRQVGALLFDLLLVALIWFGIGLRFNWVNWSEGTDLHPDEYGLTSTLTRLQIPATLEDYFNTRISPISPYQRYDENGAPTVPGPDNRMRWGQWPIILLKLAATLTDNTGYSEQRLLGRALSAAADMFAVLLIIVIGTRLYNQRVGLLAGALSALAVMQIQQSHFMTSDNFGTLFVAVGMYAAVRVAQAGPGSRAMWGWATAFGVCFGMAVATRINLAPFFGVLMVAVLAAFWPRLQRGGWLNTAAWSLPLAVLALAGVMSLLTFRVTHPMSFRAETGDTTLFTLTPNKDWLDSLAVASAESSGQAGGPPAEQWTNRPTLVFPFVNMVLYGLGLPLGVMAWLGVLWAGWRTLKHDWRVHAVPLVWALGFFLFMGTRWVMSVRYFLPIYPFLALFAAWALYEIWARVRARPARWAQVGAAALFALTVGGTLSWAWGFTNIYRAGNTRVNASRWIYQNIPAPLNVRIQLADGTVYNEPLPFPPDLPLTADQVYQVNFRAQVTGHVVGVYAARAINTLNLAAPGQLNVTLTTDTGETLSQGALPVLPIIADEVRGQPASATLPPISLEADKNYALRLQAAPGSVIVLSGSVIANENWDESLPSRLDGRDGFGGLYRGLEMSVRWLDDENKRQMYFNNLPQVDYLILPSQRGLWSVSRLPAMYPMTMDYYRALFDGRLGFELVAEFHNPIVVGPLHVSDVGGTVGWGAPPRPLPHWPDNPFNFNLLAAEEAFSVYDHAPVWIFKKRADFSPDMVQAVLGTLDLTAVVNQGPRDATEMPTALMLPADLLAAQRAGGTWSAMFDATSWVNTNEGLAVLAWYVTLLLLGALAFPVTFVAFGAFADRGYALSKTVALLILTWLVWLAASLQWADYSRGTIVLAVGVLALGSALVLAFRWREVLEFLGQNTRYILAVEGVTLALFVLMLGIRFGNPDLWHPNFGGEKPMDFSYFNAVLRSTYFPPYDPWFAGGYLNYYYYGFVVAGIPTKLLGVVPALAYNLLLPMFFALLGINAFGVAYNLAARLQPVHPRLPYLAGVAAALMIAVLGNLGQVKTFITGFQRASDVGALAQSWAGNNPATQLANGLWRVFTGQSDIPIGTGSWYWDATRIIPFREGDGAGPITEFPFFTFLYADLHAHLMSLPFTVLALAWALAYFLGVARRQSLAETAWQLALGGLALGILVPINTWDYPVYLALALVGMLAGHALTNLTLTRMNVFNVLVRVGTVVGLAALLYRPYEQWFASAYTSAEPWNGSNTPLESFWYVHGLFLFILVSFLVRETRAWLADTPAEVVTVLGEVWGWVVGALVMLALALAALLYLQVNTALVALPLMAWAGALLLRPDLPNEKRVILFLLGTGLALTLVVELVTLSGDIGRMNTVFKFYLQVWTLFSVAAGAALAHVWSTRHEWQPNWRSVWTGTLTVLVFASALYTVTAASAKMRDRFPGVTAIPNSGCQALPDMVLPYTETPSPVDQPPGLYGLNYMTWSAYCDNTYFLPLVYDYEAIRWLQDNVAGSPVLVEAQTFNLYRMSSRYAWNTGLPNVVGWDWHQRQQRGAAPSNNVPQRGYEVSDFYQNPNLESAIAFLRRYDVGYVVVGPMERAYYPADGLAKFATLVSQGVLRPAYENPGVIIYEVVK